MPVSLLPSWVQPPAPTPPPLMSQGTTLQSLFPTLDVSKIADANYMSQFANPDEGAGERYLLQGSDGKTYGLNTTLSSDASQGGSINITNHYGAGDTGGGTYTEFGRDGNLLASRDYMNDPNGVRDFITMGAMFLGPLAAGGAFGAAAEAGEASSAVSGMDLAADTPGTLGAWSPAAPGTLGSGTYDAGLGNITDANIQGSPLTAGPGQASAPLPTGEGGWSVATGGPAPGSLGAPADVLYPGGTSTPPADSGIDWDAIKSGYQVGSLLTGLLAKPQMPDAGGGGAQQPVGTLQSSAATAGGSASGNAVGGVAGSQPGVANTLLTTFEDEEAKAPGKGGTLLGG